MDKRFVICSLLTVASSSPVTLTTKSIVAHFGGSWAGSRPQWISTTGKILVKIAASNRTGDGTFAAFDERGACEQIGKGAAAVPSPDGKRFAFIGDVDGKPQLWVQDWQGVRSFTTHIQNGIGSTSYRNSIAWTADSKKLIFGYQSSASVADSAVHGSTVNDVGVGTQDPPNSVIEEIGAENGATRVIGGGPFIPESFTLSGTRLVFSAVHLGSIYSDGSFWGEIRDLDVVSGKGSTLINNHGVQSLQPAVMPGSQNIAFDDSPLSVYFPENLNVALFSDAQVHQLTTNESFPHLMQGALTPDNLSCGVFFLGKQDVYRHVYRVDCTGKLRQVDHIEANVDGFGLSPSGEQIAIVSENANGRVFLQVVSTKPAAAARVVVDLRPETDNLGLGSAKIATWLSKDGVRNQGLVVLPKDFDRRKRYPLIVDLHGGPVGGVTVAGSLTLSGPLEWHFWASRGYVVLVPDYRSSLVAGWNNYATALKNQDINEKDADDILSGVDMMVSDFNADPNHAAVYGFSTGGYETNWLITHSGRFKAAVSYEGWADWYYSWSSGGRVGGNPATAFILNGKPWEVPENYLKASPSMAIAQAITPTLFVSGSDGVALYNNQFMYGALRNRGVPTDLLIYRGEGHGFQADANVLDLFDRAVAWITKYI